MAADQTAFARALLEPPAVPAGLTSWNGSDPAARFAIHRNNVMVSLVDALASTYPVVAELVGEPFFRAMAARYVRREPPRTPILAHYGGGFAAFVAAFEPAAGLPYLADVARLEWARVQACHAADVAPVDASAVAAALASGARIGEHRIGLQPALHGIASAHAVLSLWQAHQGALDLAEVDPSAAEAAIVLRDDFEVLVLPAPPGAVAFIDALARGCNLGSAAGEASVGAADFDPSAVLSLLLSHQAITSICLPQGDSS